MSCFWRSNLIFLSLKLKKVFSSNYKLIRWHFSVSCILLQFGMIHHVFFSRNIPLQGVPKRTLLRKYPHELYHLLTGIFTLNSPIRISAFKSQSPHSLMIEWSALIRPTWQFLRQEMKKKKNQIPLEIIFKE